MAQRPHSEGQKNWNAHKVQKNVILALELSNKEVALHHRWSKIADSTQGSSISPSTGCPSPPLVQFCRRGTCSSVSFTETRALKPERPQIQHKESSRCCDWSWRRDLNHTGGDLVSLTTAKRSLKLTSEKTYWSQIQHYDTAQFDRSSFKTCMVIFSLLQSKLI